MRVCVCVCEPACASVNLAAQVCDSKVEIAGLKLRAFSAIEFCPFFLSACLRECVSVCVRACASEEAIDLWCFIQPGVLVTELQLILSI